jgi:hypothetical protein
LSFRASKEKSITDLTNVTFHIPMLEYRNNTWTWYDLAQAIRKGIYLLIIDILRAVIANTGALVNQKLFKKNHETIEENHDKPQTDSKKSNLLSTLLKRKKLDKHGDGSESGPARTSIVDGLDNMGSINSIESNSRSNDENGMPKSLDAKGKILFGKHYVLPGSQ